MNIDKPVSSYFDQQEFMVRFEWGLHGINALAPISDVMIIVDVLSFTTSVDIAVGNGAIVYPYDGPAEELDSFAHERNALIARHGRQPGEGYSLSPASLLEIPTGTNIVLPSPNGSRLSLATGTVPTLAGCLRNAAAVAARAKHLGMQIGVIAAGERWADGSLRPSLEDLLGAGAVISSLANADLSPEAEMAMNTFGSAQNRIHETLSRCGSGKELIGRGFAEDVRLASQLNASNAMPELVDGRYMNQNLGSD